MPQEWEQGNAAREWDDAPNPYQPVDYERRLRGASNPSAPYYGGVQTPPVQPSGWEPGAPYGAFPYEDQPMQPEPMPQPSWGNVPFFDEPQEAEWRDPFAPAQPGPREAEPARPSEAPKRDKRPAPRPGRLLALGAALSMLVFCLVTGGRIVLDLAANEKEISRVRDEYRQRTGVELRNAGVAVNLLPEGQTYAPTFTPQPTYSAPTAAPTPIIPINDAAAVSLNRRETAAGQPEETPTASPRTRLTDYPKNPLLNVEESLRELVAANGDVVGRLVIDGLVDEIVMQRNNTYYLTHTSTGRSSASGAVFADESCTLRVPPENLLLRGQSSEPGKVFTPLWQFVSGGAEFAASHTTARLTTLYEDERYTLIAVLVAGSATNSASYFNYASQPTFTTDEVMLSYVRDLRERSLYAFSADVQASDRLLTLATVGGDNTLVLVYRMLREGE